jgi:predicted acyltransferase
MGNTDQPGVLAGRSRIVSLDQFRGYTVAAMVLVNFIASYKQAVHPVMLHHNTYCSYPDTIMPQFFFAVGFAYRLTLIRRLKSAGGPTAYWAVLRRNLGLILLGIVVYHLGGKVESWEELKSLGFSGFIAQAFRREPFETLVHIALASLWVVPVIAAEPAFRIVYMILSGCLHLVLSNWFYFDWAWNVPVIDGGPLGFLSWTIPILVGSLAYDLVAEARPGRVARLLGWSCALMAVGYLITGLDGALDPPPFVQPAEGTTVNMWTMSQRAGSVSYLTFAAGFSTAVYALFVVLCDIGSLQVGLFRTFGQNALAVYILHEMVASAVKPYVPGDAPGWFVTLAFLLDFGICYLFSRHLEKHQLFLRL